MASDLSVSSAPAVVISEHLDGDMGVTNKIKRSMYDVARQFVYIGFLLWEVKEYEYFKEKNYNDVYEYASSELGFKRSSVCNFINVCCNFCDSDTTTLSLRLKSDYEHFNYSQLVEMLSMNDKQRALCSPDMTVRELRDIKKQDKPPDVVQVPNVQTSGRGSPFGAIGYYHMLALERYLFDRFSCKLDFFDSPDKLAHFVECTGQDFTFVLSSDDKYPVSIMCLSSGIQVNFNSDYAIIPYSVAYWVYVALSRMSRNNEVVLEPDLDIADMGRCSFCGCLCGLNDNYCSVCGSKIKH